MKKIIKACISICILCAFFFGSLGYASAVVSVKGYYRKNGTYVQPHYRSDPDGSFSNNWSTKGNVNPYTGKPGYKTSPSTYSAPKYTQPSVATPSSVNNANNLLSLDDKIKNEIKKVESKYYKNPHGFRERLTQQIATYLGTSEGVVGEHVYSMLPNLYNSL